MAGPRRGANKVVLFAWAREPGEKRSRGAIIMFANATLRYPF